MSAGKTYVRVENGLVNETVPPIFRDNGEYVPIDERTVPELLEFLIDVTDISPRPEAWWTYDGQSFAPPVSYELTEAEVLASNANQQAWLLAQISQSMAPILVSLQLGDATEEETINAKAWREYYRALKLVDITLQSPSWPVAPSYL